MKRRALAPWVGTILLFTACSPAPSPAPVVAAPPPGPSSGARLGRLGVGAASGGRCEAEFACSPDRTMALRCDGDAMALFSRCRGPRGCRVGENGVLCDQSIAEIGDACTGDGAACALDGLNLLVCRGGRFTLKSACTAGCEAESRRRVSCHGEAVTP